LIEAQLQKGIEAQADQCEAKEIIYLGILLIDTALTGISASARTVSRLFTCEVAKYGTEKPLGNRPFETTNKSITKTF